MLTYSYKNHYLKFIERMGKGDITDLLNAKTDVILKFELSLDTSKPPLAKSPKYKNSFELHIPNFLIDLRLDEETIYKKIRKSTRADIRKASEKDKLKFYIIENPSDSQLQDFSRLFNAFAKGKNLSPCNMDKIMAIRDQYALIMTYVEDAHHRILCTSILIVDEENRQLYGLYGATDRFSRAAKEERALIGRANKYLHWKEIKWAKSKGMDWYNFGGEVIRKGDQGVNDFKRRFGTTNGTDRLIYIPRTILGRLCVTLLFYRWKKNYGVHFNAKKSPVLSKE